MHAKFLLLSLEQARLGRGISGPNPSVGALAVKDGEVIARAYHRGAGTAHAEQMIIDILPADKKGVTLYVTLEPCNHYGRTPPCVDAIIRYGFEKVVFAYKDPNPIVAQNDSPSILSQAGIQVIHCPLPEIDKFYSGYKYWLNTKQPLVIAKIAQTLDGKIGNDSPECLILSNKDCQTFTHQHRQNADIILTTARTIMADNPQLNVRLTKTSTPKPVAILDRCLQLHGKEQIFQTAHHCHIFYDATLPEPESRGNVTFYPTPVTDKQHLNLPVIFQTLGRLGFHEVWVEAGGKLFTSLHNENLVHKTYIYIVPMILGAGTSAYGQNVLKYSKSINWLPVGNNLIVELVW